MHFIFNSIHEEKPGPKWQGLFEAYWPAYKNWFLSEGYSARPGYWTSFKNLRGLMPELVPIYEQLVELAGGGDLAARFLSLYCPPPYLTGCSQAVWRGDPSFLVRNYDYHPKWFEGCLLFTSWRRPVIAMSESLWGVLDGMNDAGLVVSLTFGGRRIVGEGFGVPLILRYILEVCDDTPAAVDVLQRIPVHMAYNVTILDQSGTHATVYLSPDRRPVVTQSPVGTNHQEYVEWPDYARMTSTVERKLLLEERLADPGENKDKFIRRFLRPPIYNTRYEKAFGTLYTAVYSPESRVAEYCWPHRAPLNQSFQDFNEQKTVVNLKLPHGSGKTSELVK